VGGGFYRWGRGGPWDFPDVVAVVVEDITEVVAVVVEEITDVVWLVV
jgi:hypothetical protein